MRERDILYQRGPFWAVKRRGIYRVFQDGVTCASSVEAYPTEDLARARIDYLGRKYPVFGAVVKAPPKKVDLMEALRQSLARANELRAGRPATGGIEEGE